VYEEIIAKKPDYLAGYMAIGTIYDQQEKIKGGRVLPKGTCNQEGFWGCCNNLAWKLAEKGENIDEALEYARIAKEQMPDNTLCNGYTWMDILSEG
jgi:hypothetical protein